MKLKTIISLFIFCSIFGSCKNESKVVVEKEKNNSSNLEDTFLLKNVQQTPVMLLGSWHFAFYNNDSHKVDDNNKVDYTTPAKQNEIKKVVNSLANYKPTIICVESRNQKKLDSLFQAYLQGNYTLKIDEEEQIGFRLAKKLHLKKLYAVDTYSWLRDSYQEIPALDNLWDESQYLDTISMSLWNKKYEKWYTHLDKMLTEKTVAECLKTYNHPSNLQAFLGHYLVTLKTKNHNGPDAYALKWYDRNVRIFNNILKTNPTSEDKILVIYGAGHIPILEQLFIASPQFKLNRPFNYN